MYGRLGVNHMAYVTGNFSGTADELWINAEVTGEESRGLVGETTAPFVLYHTSVSHTLHIHIYNI